MRIQTLIAGIALFAFASSAHAVMLNYTAGSAASGTHTDSNGTTVTMSGTTGVAWRQGFNPPYTEAANDNHIFISLNGPTPTAVIDFSGLSPTLTPVSLLLYDADSPTTDARTDIGLVDFGNDGTVDVTATGVAPSAPAFAGSDGAIDNDLAHANGPTHTIAIPAGTVQVALTNDGDFGWFYFDVEFDTVAVPEPSAFLALSLVFMPIAGRRYFRRM